MTAQRREDVVPAGLEPVLAVDGLDPGVLAAFRAAGVKLHVVSAVADKHDPDAD